jgi:RNA polymerase sigma-70 factor, ECF subfamily
VPSWSGAALSSSLRSVYLAHLPPGALVADDAALEAELRARMEGGRDAWPTLPLAPAMFVRFLAERSRDGVLPAAGLAPDLHLACACVHRVPGAVEALETAFGPGIRRLLARQDRTGELVDDAQQVLRERLFVGAGDAAPPKIAEYAGRAPLRSWLAAAASRTLIDLRRRARAKREDPASSIRSLAAEVRPEVQYIKERYRGEFQSAVRAAIGRISDRDRTLLKLNVADGLSIDRLAALYRVGRSTAARWLAAARGALLEETRRELCARLGIGPDEYESLAAMVRSDVELSVGGLLGQAGAT